MGTGVPISVDLRIVSATFHSLALFGLSEVKIARVFQCWTGPRAPSTLGSHEPSGDYMENQEEQIYNKRGLLVDALSGEIRGMEDSIEKLRSIGPLLYLCHQELTEEELREYLTYAGFDLESQFHLLRITVSTWQGGGLIKVINLFTAGSSLVDELCGEYDAASHDPIWADLIADMKDQATILAEVFDLVD